MSVCVCVCVCVCIVCVCLCVCVTITSSVWMRCGYLTLHGGNNNLCLVNYFHLLDCIRDAPELQQQFKSLLMALFH